MFAGVFGLSSRDMATALCAANSLTCIRRQEITLDEPMPPRGGQQVRKWRTPVEAGCGSGLFGLDPPSHRLRLAFWFLDLVDSWLAPDRQGHRHDHGNGSLGSGSFGDSSLGDGSLGNGMLVGRFMGCLLRGFLGGLQIHFDMGKTCLKSDQRRAGFVQRSLGGLMGGTFTIEILTHGLDQRLVLLHADVRTCNGAAEGGMDDRDLAVAHISVT